MAKILKHPLADRVTNKLTLAYASGTIIIKTSPKEFITYERANFLLDLAKLEVLKMFAEHG